MPEQPDAAAGARTASATFATRILDNPFVGFLPWIVLAVLEGPGRLPWAAGAALALSVVFLVLDVVRGRTVKILAVVDVVAFTAFLVLVLAAPPATQRWLETWFGEISNLILVVVVVASMIARVPFTIQYAREQTDPSAWRTPLFLRINYVITGAWALAFAVSSAAGFYGDAVLHDNSNIWTGWIIQIGASLVAVQFTQWYPDYATANALRAAGEPTEPAPPVTDLLVPLLGYLVPVGIIVLVFGGAPTWLGIALIVVGSALSVQLRRVDTRSATGG
ncbi:hypothetical protein [Nakamurella endophytica]|uniref:Uncharacterized protein n=1 Tax=Nakamurella endophytica TaxID=1748367 RepID=A0A917WE55_9ACTN|nr:hypothetical protein [Nakamurella endophytica]GGL94359.1 hypothetical protein GCM10011594_12700 [Nakamurella endophytica]